MPFCCRNLVFISKNLKEEELNSDGTFKKRWIEQ